MKKRRKQKHKKVSKKAKAEIERHTAEWLELFRTAKRLKEEFVAHCTQHGIDRSTAWKMLVDGGFSPDRATRDVAEIPL